MDESTNPPRMAMNRPIPSLAQGIGATKKSRSFSHSLASADWKAVFVVVTLVISTGAFITLLPGDYFAIEDAVHGEGIAQFIWVAIYVITFVLAWKRRHQLLSLCWSDKGLLALTGWACLSVLWSGMPAVTARHGVALIGTFVFGAYLAQRFTPKELLRLILWAFGITIAVSIFACILFPSYGIFVDELTGESAWRGVFSGKNELGRVIVFAMMGLATLSASVRSFWYLTAVIAGFWVVFMTNAITSVIYFPVALIIVFLVRRYQLHKGSRKKLIFLTSTLVILSAFVLYNRWESFTESVGKDPNLTGRTILWTLSVPHIAERPILGHGLDSFWYDPAGPVAELRAASGWREAPNAHNGIINLWIDVGLIGVLLFLWSYAGSIRNAIRLINANGSPEATWYFVFFVLLFLYGLTEISFLIRNEIFWILYISSALAVRGQTDRISTLRAARSTAS
jgi:exopolysaccharide production protein ExoQ